MVDISNAFSTSSETVADFFQKPGLAFYIPLYQREYSWDRDNITQLMEDICFGVERLLAKPDEIHFLGTIIRVKESIPANVYPRDDRALPTRIDNIIDGQQRISTLALLATLLYRRLKDLSSRLPSKDPFADLKTDIQAKLLTLEEIFSVDLRRGKPTRKPIIVRGGTDGWTYNGSDVDHYKSDVASYLAGTIRTISENREFSPLPSGNLVSLNLKRMNNWLGSVADAHKDKEDSTVEIPSASQIVSRIDETDLWSYSRPELKSLLLQDVKPVHENHKDVLSSIVQLLAFTHYLLYRCCFTVIDPVSEEWAFDMFQSLNATGTPLTAIETFKPMVVSLANEDGGFKNSNSEKNFNLVDSLFTDKSSAAQKSRLTNDYLITLSAAYDGTKLARQFSQQRQWLTDTYRAFSSQVEREQFTQLMGEHAIYLESILNFDYDETSCLPNFTSDVSMDQKELATTCVLYLHDAGHRMAHALLSQFYAMMLRQKPNSGQAFVDACKAVTAFYTLWRAARSNSGLDNVYRQMLRGSIRDGIEPVSWTATQGSPALGLIKKHLRNALARRGIGNKSDWLNHASQYYKYNNTKPACRFGLLVVSEDTVPDPNDPGLPTIGTKGSTPRYLKPRAWRSKEYRTLEHIAPQSPPRPLRWDSRLYNPDDYQLIGNLILLPAKVNTSAGNLEWKTKWLYYKHLAESNAAEQKKLSDLARQYGVLLHERTIKLLTETSHKDHMIPIVNVGIDGDWDHDLVAARTRRVCEILWERLYPWLE